MKDAFRNQGIVGSGVAALNPWVQPEYSRTDIRIEGTENGRVWCVSAGEKLADVLIRALVELKLEE